MDDGEGPQRHLEGLGQVESVEDAGLTFSRFDEGDEGGGAVGPLSKFPLGKAPLEPPSPQPLGEDAYLSLPHEQHDTLHT